MGVLGGSEPTQPWRWALFSGFVEMKPDHKAPESAFSFQLFLDTKTLATFGTTGANDCSAASGFHSYQKPMGSFATHNGWLKGTFHDDFLAITPTNKVGT
jgi:hypothetical protein